MARVGCFDALALESGEFFVRGEDGVASAPAEADDADFVRAGDVADFVDEVFDQGSGDGFAVFDEPGAEGGSYGGGGEGFVGESELFAFGELGLDGL